MKITAQQIKQLRDKTQAGFSDCREALIEAKGDIEKAEKVLQKKGNAKASKKEGRKTNEGLIKAYIHQNGKIGVLLEILCETDFVARTEEFKNLAHELSMQIAAMNPKNEKELLKQEYIRDSSKTIKNLITEAVAKLGENITIARFSRFQISK